MTRNLRFFLCLMLSAAALSLAAFAVASVTASTLSQPTQSADAPVVNFVAVSAGGGHTCGLTERGGVMCWGSNFNGQLGDGTTTDRFTPVYVKGLSAGVKAVSAGSTHTCALLLTGGVKCWGYNRYGQLGDGTKIDRWTPVDVSGLASGVASIEAGGLDTCVVTSAGGAKCWGSNYDGRLGDGTTTDRLTPVDVFGLSSGVARIRPNEAGGGHTCAVTTDGGAKCWGWNAFGQMGTGTTEGSYVPVDVSGLTSGVSDLAMGMWHTCATTGSGVKCWGDGSAGQLGNALTGTQTLPVNVVGLAGGALSVTAGRLHTCAMLSGSSLKCWGTNLSGELGDGTTIERLTPVDVIDLTGSVSAISAGGSHSCALLIDGGINCWGDNAAGELGNGDESLSYSPVPVEVVRPVEWHVFLPLINRPVYNPSFHANFTAQPLSGLAPLEVSFTNTSTGTYTSLLWDFGDGSTDTTPAPSHIYWSVGAYNPTLFLSDGVVTDTKSITIEVLPAQEYLVNGDFEQGLLAWQWNDFPLHASVVTTVVHSGIYAARLGIEPPEPLQYSYATATYSVGVLSGVQHARLSFWYWPRREGQSGDPQRSRQFAYILEGTKILQKLFEFDENLSDWQYAEFDLSPYVGKSISIVFGVYHDGNAVYDKRSALYVDDVSLMIDAP